MHAAKKKKKKEDMSHVREEALDLSPVRLETGVERQLQSFQQLDHATRRNDLKLDHDDWVVEVVCSNHAVRRVHVMNEQPEDVCTIIDQIHVRARVPWVLSGPWGGWVSRRRRWCGRVRGNLAAFEVVEDACCPERSDPRVQSDPKTLEGVVKVQQRLEL